MATVLREKGRLLWGAQRTEGSSQRARPECARPFSWLCRPMGLSLLLCLFTAFIELSPLNARENDYLQMVDLSSNTILLRVPLADNETFTIRYIHSVDHAPVYEVFEVNRDGCLALQATYFQMFGAGMGHIQGRGYVDFDGQWTWIRDIHQPLGSFILRVGSPSVDHTLIYREQETHLSERWAGKRVHISVVTESQTGRSNDVGGRP